MDPEIQDLYAQNRSLEIRDGILYRQFLRPDGCIQYYQLVVPRALRTLVLENVHSDATSGHFGARKTQEKLRKYAYWRGHKKDVELFVRRCPTCCRYRHGPKLKQGPMQLSHGCTTWQKLHIDLTGPHIRSKNGYSYLLTVICSFSKYLVAVPLRDKSALNVARAIIRHAYLVYSAAELIVHDQGREFCNEINENICRIMGIQDSKCSPYRPQANGQIERVHRTLNDIVAKTVDRNQRNWDEVMPYTVFAYNTAVHRSTTFSPFYLMFAREPVVNIDFLLQNSSPELSDNLDEFSQQVSDRMREAFATVRKSLRCSFDRAKKRYDHRVKTTTFCEGQFVWYYCPRRKLGLNRKWQLLTDGPFRVMHTLNQVNLVIQRSPKSRPFITHIDRVTKYEGQKPCCWKENGDGDDGGNAPNSERPYEPRNVGRGHGDDELTSLFTNVARDVQVKRKRCMPRHFEDFEMSKPHKRGKGSEERRRQRRAALAASYDSVRMVTESSEAAMGAMAGVPTEEELMDVFFPGGLGQEFDLNPPSTTDVGVMTDVGERRDAEVHVAVSHRSVSSQSDVAPMRLPDYYSWARIARQCRQHPDRSDGQIVAALLAEGPPVTDTERRYLEDLVFSCLSASVTWHGTSGASWTPSHLVPTDRRG